MICSPVLTVFLTGASWSTKDALTQYHRLGDSNSRHLFLTVLEAGRPRSRCQLIQCLARARFLACRRPPPHCVLPWHRERQTSRPLIPSRRSRPHLNLITPQRPHLPIQSHQGGGLQHRSMRGHVQSIARGAMRQSCLAMAARQASVGPGPAPLLALHACPAPPPSSPCTRSFDPHSLH